LISGNGGHGAITFRRDRETAYGAPNGGNGGNGGNIIFHAFGYGDLGRIKNKQIQGIYLF